MGCALLDCQHFVGVFVADQEEADTGGAVTTCFFVSYRMVRHPSGRKIEGVPLREGIELKPHQVEGVEWLLRSFMTGGGILADEMGTFQKAASAECCPATQQCGEKAAAPRVFYEEVFPVGLGPTFSEGMAVSTLELFDSQRTRAAKWP